MQSHFLILALSVCCAHTMSFGFDEGPRFYERTDDGNKIDKASVKMLKEAFNEASDKNVVMSPIAVLMLLNLYVSNTPASKLQEEVLALTGDTNARDAKISQMRLLDNFLGRAGYALSMKNKVYVSKDYTISDKFAATARDLHSEFDSINFHDLKSAVATINAWSEKETNGHLKDVVSEKMLDPATATALFNVIFFQGHWHVPFKAAETKDKDFHLDSKTTVKKPMMTLERPLMYGENKEIGARFIELPYKEDGFRMVVALPDEIDGLPKVVEKMSNKGLLDDVFALNVGVSEVILELPRFEIKAELDFNKILPKLGVNKIFSESVADIVKERAVVVDKVFQKAFVKVDEEGATAGAFTGAIMVPMSSNYQIPPPINFKVDRPFAFTILYRDIILFIGTYTH